MKINKQKISIEDFVIILWMFLITVFFILFLRNGSISFATNDDVFKSTIPSGIYGSYYVYTCYSNILEGIVLAGLYKFIPVCNWMIVLYVGYICLSYVAIGVWLIKTKGALTGGILLTLFFWSTYDSLLCEMNYAKTGGMLISTGIVIFAHFMEKMSEKKNLVWLLISGSMVFVGALIRRDSIIAALPFVLIVFADTTLKRESKGVSWGKMCTPWLILALVIITVWVTDTIIYQMNDEWRTYKEFNDVRTNLDDYGMLNYETFQEVYDQIGLDSMDVRLLSTWHSADSEVFSKENLQKIIQNKPEKEYSFANIKRCLKETYEYVMKEHYVFKVVVVLTLVCGLLYPKKLLLLLPNFLFLVTELSYLVWRGRYPERATTLVFMYAFVVIIYAFPKNEEVKSKKIKKYLTVTILLLWTAVGIYNSDNGKAIEEGNSQEYAYKEEYREFLTEISEQQQNLYVWDIGAISKVLQEAYTPYEMFDKGVLSNSVYTGGWFVNTPIMANNAERFGEKNNPYKLLANSGNIFWVTRASTDVNETLSYIRRHYNEVAEIHCVEELSGITVYSFSE